MPGHVTEMADNVAADTGDPLQECIEISDRSNVWLTAKLVLTDDAYAAMWLRYVEDMPVKDVARTMDKSVSWAKVTLMRGRRRLEMEMLTEQASQQSDASLVRDGKYG